MKNNSHTRIERPLRNKDGQSCDKDEVAVKNKGLGKKIIELQYGSKKTIRRTLHANRV
jgi:hypothetical protein